MKTKKLYPFNTPFLDLNNYKLDFSTVVKIPLEFAKAHNLIAIDLFGKILTVAMTDPDDYKIIEYLEYVTNFKVIPYKCEAQTINKAIKQGYFRTKDLGLEEYNFIDKVF